MPEAIGLTGGEGVLGSRLERALVRSGACVSQFRDDIRNAEAVRAWVDGLDVVVNLASIVPVGSVAEEPGEAICVNVGGVASVAKATADRQVRLINVSSSHVYASSSSALSESSPTGPTSLYGVTKLQGDEWVALLAADGLTARVFSFFDARQPPSYAVPGLRQRILAAEPGSEFVVRGGDSRRDLASATWVAEVLAALVRSQATGVVNVGTGVATSMLEVASLLAMRLGRDDLHLTVDPHEPTSVQVADTTRLRGLLPDAPAFDLAEEIGGFVDELS